MNDFHFLRPDFFFLLIPLTLLTLFLYKKTKSNERWEKICSADLIPYVVEFKTQGNSLLFLVIPISFFLITLGLAGPTWEKIELPVLKSKSGLVIALDLSLEMNADDIKPTRLQRAIYKINDFLQTRKEGQTALLVFSGETFVVTPLTEDVATIQSLTSVLETKIMPVEGHSVLKALKKAEQLFSEAQINQRAVLVVTSRISDQDLKESLSFANSHQLNVSVLGVGKEGTRTIADGKGGLIKNTDGSVLVTTLTTNKLKKLANDTKGTYQSITVGDTDIDALSALAKPAVSSTDSIETQLLKEKWDDKGYWLALLALPLVLVLFRKNFLLAIVLFFPVSGQTVDWDSAWKTKDQQGEELFRQDAFEKASEVFENPNWKGAALYQAGKYNEAASAFEKDDSIKGLYNLGTAKAKAKDFQGAIASYAHVLSLDPDHEDAKYNKELIENFLKKNQKNNNDNPQSKNSSDQNQEGQQQKKQDQSDDATNQQNEEHQRQESESQSNENQSDQSSQQKPETDPSDKAIDQKGQESESHEEKTSAADDFKSKMDREIKQGNEEKSEAEEQAVERDFQSISPDEEQKQLDERWLNKIKDEPGDLLRRKFLQQYKQQTQSRRRK